MNIAYVISAYKLPDQLVRLVRRLDAPGASFAVHVDRNTAADVYKRMVDGLGDVPSVTFLPRHACHWGGFGPLRATLKGLDHLFAHDVAFDYVVLLTGQDYPLSSEQAIAERLERSGGASFMTYWTLPFSAWDGRGGLDRLERYHVVRGRRLRVSLPLRRRLPETLRPFGGGTYWCLARAVAEHVQALVRTDPGLVRIFEHAYLPDELFFQTVVLNSEHADTVENDNLRYIDWSSRPAPKVLTRADLPAMLESGKLFARKFDATVDATVLDELDAHADGRLNPAPR